MMKKYLQIAVLLLLGQQASVAQWQQKGPVSLQVIAMTATAKGYIYAAGEYNDNSGGYGIYRSIDSGKTWVLKSAGMPNSSGKYGYVYDLEADVDTVYMLLENSGSKIWRSTNDGESWAQYSTGISGPISLTVTPQNWFAPLGNYLYRSTDHGKNWSKCDSSTATLGYVFYNDGKVFDGAHQSTDGGSTWTARASIASQGVPYSLMAWNGDTLYGATYNGIHVSPDNGQTWHQITDYSGSTPSNALAKLVRVGKKMFVWATVGGGTGTIWRSTYPFNSWEILDVDLPGDHDRANKSHAVVGGSLLVGMGRYGIYRTDDGGESWLMSNNGIPGYYQFKSLASSGSNILGIGGAWFMLRSSDNGETWVQSSRGMTINPSTNCVVMRDTVALAGTAYSSAYVYRSGDYGKTWRASGTGIHNSVDRLVYVGTTGDTVVASTRAQFFRSTDGGNNWTGGTKTWAFGQPCPRGAMTVLGTNIYTAITDNLGNGGISKSTDLGDTWTPVGTDSVAVVNAITTLGGSLIASCGYNWGGGVIWRSDDEGATWYRIMTGIPANSFTTGVTNVGARLVVGATLILGARQTFTSGDGGANWVSANDGLPGGYMGLQSATFNHPYIFIALNNGLGIFRRDRTDFLTAVGPNGPEVPKSMSLEQNYPNPFNPTTNFSYQISDFGFVSLKVYDVLGREVATLVNEKKAAGNYSASWDASGVPSGVYFYRLTAGGVAETKRMALVR